MGSKNLVMIDLCIGDQLTSISCGHIVVEIIKFLAYQRLQIPYTYQWLKQVVNRKKVCENQNSDSLQSEQHFNIASRALDNLDFITKSLLQEINGPCLPEEVCIAFGTTMVTCKEVYRLILPTLCHKPQCHSSFIESDKKIQCTVFKTLVTSEKLNNIFYTQLPPTNMYALIRKRIKNQKILLNSDNFSLANDSRIPRNCKIIIIDFRTKNKERVACCNEFKIFGDIINTNLINLQLCTNYESDNEEDFNEIESTDDIKWYQSSYVMKGFKDCIVNGSSITNSWLVS